MTITHLGAKRLKGLSSDTRPTNVPAGSILENTDTNKSEIFNNNEWYPVLGSGGWKELGRTTLGATSDTISVSSLPNKRYYMVLSYLYESGQIQDGFRFGNGSVDTGTNYAIRSQYNGDTDATGTSQSSLSYFDNNNPIFNVGYLANHSNKEKLLLGHIVGQNTAGAGNAPTRRESTTKWANTTSQITSLDLDVGSGTSDVNSNISILGTD